MRARVILILATVALVVLSPLAAEAQVVVPPGGDATVGTPEGRTGRTPRIAGTPRGQRTPGTPRGQRTPGTPRGQRTPRTGRIPGTGRVPGTFAPQRLPATGVSTTALAMDAAALLALGALMLRLRRRYA